MIQEIITYIIIGSAVTLIILKVAKRFGKRKTKTGSVSAKQTVGHSHKCADCSAECQLRDLPNCLVEKNQEESGQVEKKSKFFQS